MSSIRLGILLEPQYTTYSSYANAVKQVEELGVDSIWDWDHFMPFIRKNDRDDHFEGWTILTAIATLTKRAEIGCMVTCNSYRNPALLSNMAKTVDHISGGRLILGIGAGWFEREYNEYGYTYGNSKERLQALAKALPIIKQRWLVDQPPPIRNPIPILIGGEGEQITLKLVAMHANIWNGFGPPENYRRKNQVLNDWCKKVGRNPNQIERSVLLETLSPNRLELYVRAGAQHLIVHLKDPWDFKAVEKLVQWREGINKRYVLNF